MRPSQMNEPDWFNYSENQGYAFFREKLVQKGFSYEEADEIIKQWWSDGWAMGYDCAVRNHHF